MHNGGLLRVHWNESLGHSFFDMSLDDGREAGGHDMRKMPRDIRAEQQFLDLNRETLWRRAFSYGGAIQKEGDDKPGLQTRSSPVRYDR